MTTLDEKYEDEGYRNLMKNFAASAASGDLAGLEKGLAEVILVQFHYFGNWNYLYSHNSNLLQMVPKSMDCSGWTSQISIDRNIAIELTPDSSLL